MSWCLRAAIRGQDELPDTKDLPGSVWEWAAYAVRDRVDQGWLLIARALLDLHSIAEDIHALKTAYTKPKGS